MKKLLHFPKDNVKILTIKMSSSCDNFERKDFDIMASDTVNNILAAEKESEEKIAEAKRNAVFVKVAAEESAAEIVKKSIDEAEKKAKSIVFTARQKAEEIENSPFTSESEKTAVDKEKYKSAVQAVCERVIS